MTVEMGPQSVVFTSDRSMSANTSQFYICEVKTNDDAPSNYLCTENVFKLALPNIQDSLLVILYFVHTAQTKFELTSYQYLTVNMGYLVGSRYRASKSAS